MGGGYRARRTGIDGLAERLTGLARSVDARRQAQTNIGVAIDPASGNVQITGLLGSAGNIGPIPVNGDVNGNSAIRSVINLLAAYGLAADATIDTGVAGATGVVVRTMDGATATPDAAAFAIRNLDGTTPPSTQLIGTDFTGSGQPVPVIIQTF
jgi:hypothetical protein